MNHFQFSDFGLSPDAARKPALVERPLPPLALRNPIEAAEALFRELGLDRFLERRAQGAQQRVEKALVFTSTTTEAGEAADEPQTASDAPAALAQPLPKPLAQQPDVPASASEGADAGENGGYFIETPWFADQDDETEAGEAAQTALPDAAAGLADHADSGDLAGDAGLPDGDLNDPARVWTSEDIMMLILRDEARAAEIAAWNEAALAQGWDGQDQAEAA